MLPLTATRRVLVALMLILLSGCVALKMDRHYLLSAITPETKNIEKSAPLLLVLKPLELPNYVKQSEILTREQGSTVALSKMHRWAEPMINGVERVLIQDLAQRINGEVLPYAQRLQAPKIDYFILVNITDFIGTLGQEAIMNVHWQILDGKRQKAVRFKHARYREPLADRNYETLVSAQSRLLARLSEDLSGEVENLSRP